MHGISIALIRAAPERSAASRVLLFRGAWRGCDQLTALMSQALGDANRHGLALLETRALPLRSEPGNPAAR